VAPERAFTLFAVPHAGERNFFYGVNFELSYETPPCKKVRQKVSRKLLDFCVLLA
jgi:hypothetical protein